MIAATRAFLASPRFTQALTESIVGVALAAFAVRALLGWPGSIAVLSALVARSIPHVVPMIPPTSASATSETANAAFRRRR